MWKDMRKNCVCCESPLGEPLLRFGSHPIAGGLSSTQEEALSAQRYALNWYFCEKCAFLQQNAEDFKKELLEVIYPQQLHTYSMLPWLRDYLLRLVNRVRWYHHPPAKILEIGCNDGQVLDLFRQAGYQPIGIEPGLKMVEACRALGLEVMPDFLNQESANAVLNKYGLMDVILARHVFEHVLNLGEFLSNVRFLMNGQSVLIIEVPSILEVLRSRHIEGMTHPHVSFFSLTSLEIILGKSGLFLKDIATVPADGGSLLTWWGTEKTDPSSAVLIYREVQRLSGITRADTYRQLQVHFDHTKTAVSQLSEILLRDPHPCLGYGAGAKGTAMVNWFGLKDTVRAVIDRSPEKVGKWIPGTGQPVISIDAALAMRPECVIVLAPTHLEAILERETALFSVARAITILPELSIVSL